MNAIWNTVQTTGKVPVLFDPEFEAYQEYSLKIQ